MHERLESPHLVSKILDFLMHEILDFHTLSHEPFLFLPSVPLLRAPGVGVSDAARPCPGFSEFCCLGSYILGLFFFFNFF